MKRILLFFLFMIFSASTMRAQDFIDSLINSGEFKKAEEQIQRILVFETDETKRYELNFKLDLMQRIRRDFRRAKADVLKYIAKYYPDVNDTMLEDWESKKHLEMRIIDGEKRYFANAAPNLFRLNPEAKARKAAIDGVKPDTLDLFLAKEIPAVINEAKQTGERFAGKKRIRLDYSISVDADAVPEGEIIRCWMPYPRETVRQKDIALKSTSEAVYIIAPNSTLQRSIYMEKPAVKGVKTEFAFSVEYTAASEYNDLAMYSGKLDNATDDMKQHLGERAPHIVFTDKIKNLSAELVKPGMTDIQKVKAFYEWIDGKIPWASALEYSTITNISDYCLTNMHGDCGIKTLLFMTLCRYNGIPAKWQSGWMLHPGSLNLHDWCEIYIPELGWVPVDQSFGIQKLLTGESAYFFLGSIDSYHLTVNDDYSSPFFPAKIYPRSETVDFQRGEVEWKGGNLYFNKWDYNMRAKFLD